MLAPAGRAPAGEQPQRMIAGRLGARGERAAHPVPPSVCVLQAQTQELEELNKELRQCNLQQFIQQTGATVTVLQARSEEDAQPEPSPCELPAYRRNGGQHAAAGSAAGAAPRDPARSLPPSSPLGTESRQVGVCVLTWKSLTTPTGFQRFFTPGAPSSSPLKPRGCS